jgi:hypothetical protein
MSPQFDGVAPAAAARNGRAPALAFEGPRPPTTGRGPPSAGG